MQVILNGEFKEIKIASISTLLDVVTQIEKDLPKDNIITEVLLNDKVLESNWMENAKNIYLLDEDKLELISKDSDFIAKEALENSKNQFAQILKDFESIADMFRVEDEKKANQSFAQTIENLQWYFKVIEDAIKLYGKDLSELSIENKTFSKIIEELSNKLTEMIDVQKDQDWVLLADLIEYELIPQLKKIDQIYEIIGID